MEATRNLCAQIPISLHDRVREERESLGQSLSEYVTRILREHFEGGKSHHDSNKTLAFQIPESWICGSRSIWHRKGAHREKGQSAGVHRRAD